MLVVAHVDPPEAVPRVAGREEPLVPVPHVGRTVAGEGRPPAVPTLVSPTARICSVDSQEKRTSRHSAQCPESTRS